MQRGRIAALELALRAAARLGRWDDVLARADALLADAEKAAFRTRIWRILATRAHARDASGDAAGARGDRRAAHGLLDDMAAHIADPELRATFEADARVLEVRKA